MENEYRYAAKCQAGREEAEKELFKVAKFRKEHGATGKPLDDLERLYAERIITYGRLEAQLLKM